MKYSKTPGNYLLFSITIFLNAFLLFQVQPIIGKYILPWFGGTSFVWITSLLFFQILLLAGYFYAYLLAKISLKKQLIIHSTFVLATGLLTIYLFFQWNSSITPAVALLLPNAYSPIIQVLGVLLISVGLPYMLLSTTSTLLQRWFSLLPYQKSPYPLYALSNVGSLLAIATYPFIIEPFLPLSLQGKLWSVLFFAVCLTLVLCIAAMGRYKKITDAKPLKKGRIVSGNWQITWLVFPAVSSIVLLAGTHQLTQSIAPIPFLWLLPLGLYLLSFILCFSERPFYKRNFYAYSFLFSVPFVLTIMLYSPVLGAAIELSFYILMFFSCFMLCHGELFDQRPTAEKLNLFYLIMAAGSVIGSLIVAIIAPLLFVGLFWESLLGLCAASFIAAFILINSKKSRLYNLLKFLLIGDREMKLYVFGIVAAFFIIIAAGLFNAQISASTRIWRNYYGTLRILDDKETRLRCLLNGKIIHGCQSIVIKDAMKPTSYYTEKGIGLLVSTIRERQENNLRFGVIGLGVGVMTAYATEGDYIKFYELNPLDVEIAKTHFRYITQTPAEVAIVIGDGRLSMEKELENKEPQQFNLLLVDAFNDDAIPVHLLTKEAFTVYKSHLAKSGVIAVHISNSYLDLAPVIEKAAEYHNLSIVIIDAPPTNTLQAQSKWAFLTNDPSIFTTEKFKNAKKAPASNKDIRLWTDDYSNLFQIVKYYPE